jgi:hypothetical protein
MLADPNLGGSSRGLAVAWLDSLKSDLMGMAFDLKTGKKEIIGELYRVWRGI